MNGEVHLKEDVLILGARPPTSGQCGARPMLIVAGSAGRCSVTPCGKHGHSTSKSDIPMFVHRLNMIEYIRNWFPK